MNKGLIAKCQNFKGQIKDSHFGRENGAVTNPLFIPFLSYNRGSHMQKKKKHRCAKIPSSQSRQNVDQMVYHKSRVNPISFVPRHAFGVRDKTHHQQSNHGRIVSVLIPAKN
jgi:hypothetical protein